MIKHKIISDNLIREYIKSRCILYGIPYTKGSIDYHLESGCWKIEKESEHK